MANTILHKAESRGDADHGWPLKMPVLFLGHGSPMNAIEENEFVAGFSEYSQNHTETGCYFMYFGTLGDARNFCNGYGKTRNHS